MMPLQKLEKSCKKINCVMTIIVRLLERTVVVSLTGNAPGNASAGVTGRLIDGDGTGRRTSISSDFDSSVCNSNTVVVVAISRTDKEVRDVVESESIG
jgi:hypothetical protein